MRLRCFHHPLYHYPLPEEHPFPMDKFSRSRALLESEVPAAMFLAPEPAPWEMLTLVHDSTYLTAVRDGGLSIYDRNRLGLPADAALFDRCRRETHGTVLAMRAALEFGVAANLGGGTHHAFAARGLGFCVLNDVAVACAVLRAERPGLRALVLDTDAHQGNGTHALLRGQADRFSVSLHVGRNYPTEKEAGDLDVALPRGVAGPEYLAALEAALAETARRFVPDVVFWNAGADLHVDDRFGQMALTDADFAARDTMILGWTRARRVPLVALYGGGYNRDRAHTARLHVDTVRRVASAYGAL
jgi:acetoin utilization deacetylase AcuC-like enzyme